MKKLFIAFAACAMLVACGKKAAQAETEVVEGEEIEAVEEAVEAEAEEAVEAEVSELPTLIDQYVAACEAEDEVEATRVAKRIHGEYEEQLTSNDIERMANASAALAEKRAGQAEEAVNAAADALKGFKK